MHPPYWVQQIAAGLASFRERAHTAAATGRTTLPDAYAMDGDMVILLRRCLDREYRPPPPTEGGDVPPANADRQPPTTNLGICIREAQHRMEMATDALNRLIG